MVLGRGEGPGLGQREAQGRHLDLEWPCLSGLGWRRPENIPDWEVVDGKADARRSKDFHDPRKKNGSR